MKLRKKQSGFNIGREGQPPKKPLIRVTSVAYILLLVGLFIYVAHFAAMRILTIEGVGRVELTRVFVGAGSEGIVRAVHVTEREKVSAGQIVASLTLNPNEERGVTSVTPIQRDILGTMNDLARMRSRHGLLTARLREKEQRLRGMLKQEEYERALELRLAENTETQRLVRDIEDLRYSASELGADIRHEEAYLAQLQTAAQNVPLPSRPVTETALTSPVSGTVVAVFKQLRDFLTKEDVLMAIVPTGARVRIRAFFDIDDLEHLASGRGVFLLFPDGRKIHARIGEIFASTSRSRASAPDPGQTTPARVEVEVLAPNTEDFLFWHKYDSMDINIRVNREWFDFGL